MTERSEVYRCFDCGEIIEVLHPGAFLLCCGKPMKKLKINSADASKEKHMPVIKTIDGGVEVSVGEVAHPMEEKHFIQWIELVNDQLSYKKFFKPGEEPKATFLVDTDVIRIRAYCNLHGLWDSTLEK